MKHLRTIPVLGIILLFMAGACEQIEQMEADPMFQKSGSAFFKNGDAICTDLIAGQHIDVGEVEIWNDADYLYVKYIVDDENWCLTETHLHVATDPDLIPQKNGNPIPGKFDYKGEHDCVYELIYEIPLDWDCNEEIYIASHAVVKKETDLADLPGLEAALPDQVTMIVVHPGTGFGAPSYFDASISGGTILDGTYDNYCIDTDNTISPGTSYLANVYSSYGLLPEGTVEYPENLDLVNWIINQDYVGMPSGCGGNYTYGDVQRAIWALVEDAQSTSGLGSWSQCRVDEILAAAYTSGDGFIPGCGDRVAVILAPVDGSQVTIAQVTFIQVGVPCLYIEETAWRGCEEFPGKNWALYSTYEIVCCQEGIYLSDGGSGKSTLNEVVLDDGTQTATLTELYDFTSLPHFDYINHIGVSPDGNTIYVVDQSDGYFGEYDIGSGNFIEKGQLSPYPGGVVQVAVSPEGDLYVASQLNNRIYSVNLSTLNLTLLGNTGVNISGADLTFVTAGTLYLYTNTGSKLYEIDLIDGHAFADVNISSGYVTGLATLPGTNILLMSDKDYETIIKVNPDGTGRIEYNMVGFNHTYGDMASSLCSFN